MIHLFVSKCLMSNEIYFDLADVVPSYLPSFYNASEVRIAKYNRTTSVLNARADLFIDLTDDLEVEIAFYYNRLNNNQYNKMLMGVPRGKICYWLDKYYNNFMADLKNTSNFPQLKADEKFCPAFPPVRIIIFFRTTDFYIKT